MPRDSALPQLRVIAHIDIDCAYAGMEAARLGIDPAVPLAVQQWNGLIAVNYAARAYGITRHESPAEALKKCPDLVMVHCATYRNGDTEPGYWEGAKPETHKISLDPYRRESLKILKVFGEFCPTVEKASIDESFLDLTLPVRAKLLERYPRLGVTPENDASDLPSPSDLGVTVDWDSVGNLIPIYGPKKDASPTATADGEAKDAQEEDSSNSTMIQAEANCSTPAAALEEEPPLSWSDVALAIGAEIVMQCRNAVHERLRYTCSAGIASNKMLAKLCSAWKKPNAQTILRSAAVPAFLHPMPFQKIRNLGGKLGTQVSEAYEAVTVGDLLAVTLPELQSKLGDDSGTWLYETIRGLDNAEVETKTEVKSMLSSKNFRPTITRYVEVCHWLNILATELHLRLCEAREQLPGLWPKTITFTHRSANYVIRSHQSAFPFTSRLNIPYINKFGEKLLRSAIGEKLQGVGPDTKIGPYSNIQLSFSSFEKLEEGQKGIERFFVGKLPATTKRPGVSTGSTTPPAKKNKMGDQEAHSARVEELVLDDGDEEIQAPNAAVNLPTYDCPRCAKIVVIPPDVVKTLLPDFNQDAVNAALQKEQDEHADWHFARDMLEEDRKQSRVEGSSKGGKSGKDGGKKGSGSRSKALPVQSASSKGTTKQSQQSLKSFFGR